MCSGGRGRAIARDSKIVGKRNPILLPWGKKIFLLPFLPEKEKKVTPQKYGGGGCRLLTASGGGVLNFLSRGKKRFSREGGKLNIFSESAEPWIGKRIGLRKREHADVIPKKGKRECFSRRQPQREGSYRGEKKMWTTLWQGEVFKRKDLWR